MNDIWASTPENLTLLHANNKDTGQPVHPLSLINAFVNHSLESTVKTVLRGHSKRRQKIVFKTDYHFMQVKSIAECSKGSILQYFRPSLSYHLSLRSLIFSIFE